MYFGVPDQDFSKYTRLLAIDLEFCRRQMWVQLPLANASVNYMTEVYVQEQRSFHIVYILSLSHTLHVLSHLNIHAVCNLATRGTLHRPHTSNARIEGRSGLVFLPVKMLEVSECLSFLSQMICVHVQE